MDPAAVGAFLENPPEGAPDIEAAHQVGGWGLSAEEGRNWKEDRSACGKAHRLDGCRSGKRVEQSSWTGYGHCGVQEGNGEHCAAEGPLSTGRVMAVGLASQPSRAEPRAPTPPNSTSCHSFSWVGAARAATGTAVPPRVRPSCSRPTVCLAHVTPFRKDSASPTCLAMLPHDRPRRPRVPRLRPTPMRTWTCTSWRWWSTRVSRCSWFRCAGCIECVGCVLAVYGLRCVLAGCAAFRRGTGRPRGCEERVWHGRG